MSEQKKEITLNVNGQQVKGKEGDTILDVCRANNIDVPTLCFLEGLSAVGACRLCVVEIEGERRINPACTYPARDGLVVRTHTDNLEQYRRLILELLFTERNHFCFFCEASGDCELQSMAYSYQMDHARYPYTFPALPTDTLNDYLVIDHNRCILCGRCVRECSEVVANNTLDFGRRGWRTLVAADLNQPLGQSSCISCGACAQVCPTGAIFSKVSAYRGRTSEGNMVRSICSLCGIGCPIDVLVKDNNIVRIDGVDSTGHKGQLCNMGRFEQVNGKGPRVTTPLVQDKGGNLQPATWEQALGLVAERLEDYRKRHGPRSIGGLVTSLSPNETLSAFGNLMRETIGTNFVDTFDGSVYRTLARGISTFSKNGQGLEIESPLEAILESDCIVVAGSNPFESHPVAGSYILKSRGRNGSKLVLIDSRVNPFGSRADIKLRPREGGEEALFGALAGLVARKKGNVEKRPGRGVSVVRAADETGLTQTQIKEVAAVIGGASKPVFIYGEGILDRQDPRLVARLLDLARAASPDGLGVVSLKPRGNSRGAWELGIANHDSGPRMKPRFMYILLGDDGFEAGAWMDQVQQTEFLVVQASYHSPLTACANVVLPSPIWAEREGEYVSLDGKAGRSTRVVEPPAGIKTDGDVITELAKLIGKRK